MPYSDAGKDWGQEEKGTAEGQTVRWPHWLNGHEFEQTPGDGEGQRSLVYCSLWGQKSWTWLSDWIELNCICVHVRFSTTFFRFLRNITERTKLTNTYHSLKLDLESWSAHPLSSPELYSVETSGYMYSFPFKSRTELSLNLISLFLSPKTLLYPTKSS